jgi:acyl-CoA dehydrogenase
MLALARTVQMAGTLTRVLELSLQYAGEREQFGRPIARFQAIQHTLAVMAAETAAALKAADAAVAALDAVATETAAGRVALEVAAAKARVGEACGLVAEQAHQVHGAMGYTHEHQLHHFTRRLWAWRDEYGTESYWQQHLGRHLAGLGADSLWDYLATRG